MAISSTDLKSELMIAMIREDVAEAARILDKDPSLVNHDNPLWYAVHMALKEKSNFAICELLLQRGADVNHVDDNRSSILIELMANHSETHSTPAINLALQNFFRSLVVDWHADVNLLDSLNMPAICYAIKNDNVEAVRLLVEQGARFEFLKNVSNIGFLSNIKDTRILMAVLFRTDAVRHLQENSISWNFKSFILYRPMFVLGFLEQCYEYD